MHIHVHCTFIRNTGAYNYAIAYNQTLAIIDSY